MLPPLNRGDDLPSRHCLAPFLLFSASVNEHRESFLRVFPHRSGLSGHVGYSATIFGTCAVIGRQLKSNFFALGNIWSPSAQSAGVSKWFLVVPTDKFWG
jgi:hypothetical protein